MPKMIGVLGGMGPAATADFFRKIIHATPAKADRDHLKVLIFSNPQVLDATTTIQGQRPDLLPVLAASNDSSASDPVRRCWVVGFASLIGMEYAA